MFLDRQKYNIPRNQNLHKPRPTYLNLRKYFFTYSIHKNQYILEIQKSIYKNNHFCYDEKFSDQFLLHIRQ